MKIIKPEDLKPGMMAAQDFYSESNRYIPLIRKYARLTVQEIEDLRRLKIWGIYILDKSEWPKRGGDDNAPARNLYVPKPKPTIDIKLKNEALRSIEDVFTATNLGGPNSAITSAQVIKHMDTVVGQLVDSIGADPKALININDLKSYDDYTFHHSLSVAILSLAIAQHLGFDREQLKRFGMCAIMHDIGKIAVPVELIRKPSKLDDDEFRVVKGHTAAGYEYLAQSEIHDEEILQGVLHHHEKYDGTGYPDGLLGDGIPFWSRIVSVADVYDALTSNRPYRTPMQPGEAVEYIMGGVESFFDYEVVKAFVNKLELYPLGSVLELSDGRRVIVLNNKNQLRPVVRDTATRKILDLYQDRELLSVVVKRLVTKDDESK